MEGGLAGKVAIVTGSSRGIGEANAQLLARERIPTQPQDAPTLPCFGRRLSPSHRAIASAITFVGCLGRHSVAA